MGRRKREGAKVFHELLNGLTAHGVDLNFGIVLHGSRAKLDELRSFKLSS